MSKEFHLATQLGYLTITIAGDHVTVENITMSGTKTRHIIGKQVAGMPMSVTFPPQVMRVESIPVIQNFILSRFTTEMTMITQKDMIDVLQERFQMHQMEVVMTILNELIEKRHIFVVTVEHNELLGGMTEVFYTREKREKKISNKRRFKVLAGK